MLLTLTKKLKGILLLCIVISSPFLYSAEKVEVFVGGYVFPPFVQERDGKWSGITHDMIKLLNSSQNKFIFKFKKTSSLRRYTDLENNKYSVIFFENIDWGWDHSKVEATESYLKGGEVFITKASPQKSQSYFDNLKGKSILGYLGYHYSFASFKKNTEYLEKQHNARMTNSHKGNIRSVSLGRADLAIVTKSYLEQFFNLSPHLRDKFLISQRLDQIYNHTVIVKKSSVVTAKYLNLLFKSLRESGELQSLWKKHGLSFN